MLYSSLEKLPRLFCILLLSLSSFLLNGCGDKFIATERTFNDSETEFTISGEMNGDQISLTYKLKEEGTLNALSFGMNDTSKMFQRYGGQKIIDVLSDNSLKTYIKDYVEPGIGCPAWFMNKNLRSIVLIAADDLVALELDDYDLPFSGLGTEFSLNGHYLEHINNRYIENGENINLRIMENISIISNVGNASRPIAYFLVKEIL